MKKCKFCEDEATGELNIMCTDKEADGLDPLTIYVCKRHFVEIIHLPDEEFIPYLIRQCDLVKESKTTRH